MLSTGIVVMALALGLVGCASDAESKTAGSTEIASGTTDGYEWTAVLTEDAGNTCVGFEVGGEPWSTSCDGGSFPEKVSVLEYVGAVVQGMDRFGFVFLGTDQAGEVLVSFDDGSQTRRRLEASADLPPDVTASAFLGPHSGQPVRVTVTSVDGQPLLDYEVPPPGDLLG